MSFRFASLIGSIMLAQGGIALAQDTTDPNTFLRQEGLDLWRASKLSGVSIYGPDRQRVGAISDVLVGHNGGAKFVVVGVGGFLGIGTKDVAIPYDQVTFSDEPIVPPMTANETALVGTVPNGTAASGTMAPAGTMAPMASTGLGTPADTTDAIPGAASSNAAASMTAALSTTYPDHGSVTLTRDQLKSAPDFQFAK